MEHYLPSRQFSCQLKRMRGEVEIRAVLPGVNCGACGYGTCDGYAAALASDNTVKTNPCIPGADSVAEKLSQLTGAPYEGVVERIAYVKCGGRVLSNC